MRHTKLFLLAALSAMTLSCNEKVESNQPATTCGITEITASFADGQTKTVLGDDAKTVLWSPKDEISVFYDGDGMKFTGINSTPKSKTIFMSSRMFLYGGTESASEEKDYLYGVYPYASDNAQEGDQITLTVPAFQTAVEGSFERGAYPSVGRSKDNNMAFYNVCGGIRFTVCRKGITKIILKSNNHESMAGKVKVKFDEDGKPKVSAVVEGQDSIILTAPSGTSFKTDKWYYIVVLPGTLSSGFKMTFNTNNQYAVLKSASVVSFKRSIFGSMADADEGLIYKDKTDPDVSSIIIKELYHGGFYSASESKAKTGIDAYVVLYNNSAFAEAANDIVFCFGAPYNANATNKYYAGSSLIYENENWIPAYGAIWWFTKPVTIPAYSSIVVAIWGAIDHTKTYPESVDLSKSEYYWMSNQGLTQYTNEKYTCSENIKSDHYLTCSPYTQGNAWALSTSCPAFYIGKLDKAEAERLSKDTENYDKTMGSSAASYVVKFPKANVVDAVEVYAAASVVGSKPRFPAAINTGYISFTNGKGYTVYRNVDAEATRALAENEGLLVEGYAADPSGIDAEKSIANGAHIIFKDTNSSTNDFHQREVASLK